MPSQRETQIDSDLHLWQGVDQRTQPTLLPSGFFSMSRGVFFGAGEDIERLPGKKLSGLLLGPIFNIWQFDKVAFVQSEDQLWMLNVSDLTDFQIDFAPDAPAAPTAVAASESQIDVTTPASFPTYATSFSLQRSLDLFSWSTIATGLATSQTYNDTGLTPSTLYYYRALAVNASASTAGPSVSETTPAAPSGDLRLTETGDTRTTETGDSRIIE